MVLGHALQKSPKERVCSLALFASDETMMMKMSLVLNSDAANSFLHSSPRHGSIVKLCAGFSGATIYLHDSTFSASHAQT